MKNGFFKKMSQGFTAVMVVVAAQAAHSEGLLVAPSSSGAFSPAVSSGRAVLKTHDLQNLLQGSLENTAATKPAPTSFLMALSDTDQARLARMIERISVERAALENKLHKEADKKIASIRSRRHNIQTRRVSSFGANEQKLSKQLFETILAESNVDAEMKKELEKFDNSHLVQLDFVEFKGMRVVQAISLGTDQLWTVQKTINVAQAR